MKSDGCSGLRSKPIGLLKSHFVSVDGVSTHARVGAGGHKGSDAPAVVLVHGLVISSRYMIPTAERLAPFFRVYSPDFPGFGRSGDPARVLDIGGLADHLLRWMDVMELDRPALVGNSIGCQVIADLAVRHPSRLQCAVLGGPTIDPHARRAAVQIGRLAVDGMREKSALALIHLIDYYRAGLKRAWKTFQYALQDPIEEKLPKMEAPTLVVRGARDPIVPQQWCEEVVRLLPRGQLEVIPGAPHAVNYSAPEPFARKVQAFVSQHNG